MRRLSAEERIRRPNSSNWQRNSGENDPFPDEVEMKGYNPYHAAPSIRPYAEKIGSNSRSKRSFSSSSIQNNHHQRHPTRDHNHNQNNSSHHHHSSHNPSERSRRSFGINKSNSHSHPFNMQTPSTVRSQPHTNQQLQHDHEIALQLQREMESEEDHTWRQPQHVQHFCSIPSTGSSFHCSSPLVPRRNQRTFGIQQLDRDIALQLQRDIDFIRYPRPQHTRPPRRHSDYAASDAPTSSSDSSTSAYTVVTSALTAATSVITAATIAVATSAYGMLMGSNPSIDAVHANSSAPARTSFITFMHDHFDSLTYDELVDMFPNQPHGAGQQAIDRLRVYNYKRRRRPGQQDNETKCTICREELKVGDKMCRLPCLHEFHHDEIVQWLRHNAKCPICRASVEQNN